MKAKTQIEEYKDILLNAVKVNAGKEVTIEIETLINNFLNSLPNKQNIFAAENKVHHLNYTNEDIYESIALTVKDNPEGAVRDLAGSEIFKILEA